MIPEWFLGLPRGRPPKRRRSVEIELLGQHGDHAGDLLLLAEARVLGPRLEAGGHHVVDARQDLHDLQLLAELVEDVAQRLHEPGAAPGVPPRVVACPEGEGGGRKSMRETCFPRCFEV